MSASAPPPLPVASSRSLRKRRAAPLVLALVALVMIVGLTVIRQCGLVHYFSVPSSPMATEVSSGDKVMMEGFTFWTRDPRRGDVVAFKTDGISALPSASTFLMRIAGEPGELIRITDGQLIVNGTAMALSNSAGVISYILPTLAGPAAGGGNFAVPDGCYFVLGDNSANSFDSRFWGSVPRTNIIGRVSLRYWPPNRVGAVK